MRTATATMRIAVTGGGIVTLAPIAPRRAPRSPVPGDAPADEDEGGAHPRSEPLVRLTRGGPAGLVRR